ncbi:MAG: c-type cytochrome [Hyphomicrobiaceae bacterium]
MTLDGPVTLGCLDQECTALKSRLTWSCKYAPKRKSFSAAVLGLCFPLAAANIAWADSTPLTKRQVSGLAIAQKHCADCHAITRHDQSPTAVNANTAFRDLHKRYPIEMLVEGLASSTIAGHDEMPAFTLSQSGMTALLSYIDSFAPGPNKTYVNR